LLCGQPPFVGDSPVSVAYQHVREEAKAPSLMNRDVSPAIDAIVLKALAKNPLNRYQSAGEMRADLQRAVAGRPVYAEPVMPAADRGPATASHRTTTGTTRPVPARVGDSRRRRTSGWAIAALAALGVLAVAAIIAGLYASQLPSKETVPQLIGLTKDQATAQLSQTNLAADPKATACTDTNQLNKVLNQDVSAGTKLNQGSTVPSSWCAGPANVQIPPVVGEQLPVAQPQLEALHLTVKVVQADSGQPQNQVISVSPAANSTVAEGQEVTLTVSKGNLR